MRRRTLFGGEGADIPNEYKYLTFTALEDCTVEFVRGSYSVNQFYYSTNGGRKWNYIPNVSLVTVNLLLGEEVMWRAEATSLGRYDSSAGPVYSHFTSTGKIAVSGNLLSLLKGSAFRQYVNKNVQTDSYVFYGLFEGCPITTAPVFPLLSVPYSGCWQMFRNCIYLTEAPVLPAKSISQHAYMDMFKGCTSLEKVPEISLTSLGELATCYRMFEGCSNLKYIKAMFLDEPSETTTQDWVKGVASRGTYVMNKDATYTSRGTSAIPEGWTIVKE